MGALEHVNHASVSEKRTEWKINGIYTFICSKGWARCDIKKQDNKKQHIPAETETHLQCHSDLKRRENTSRDFARKKKNFFSEGFVISTEICK